MKTWKNATLGELFSYLLILSILQLTHVAQAESFYYGGEGYVEPTEKSVTPFIPPDTAFLEEINADFTVVVDPFSQNFPDISAFTTVLDAGGNPVYGLDSTTCSLTEQSNLEATPTLETITDMVSTFGGGISFALVFDVSGSMGDVTATGTRLSDAQQAAESFISQTQANDRGALVKFNSIAEIVQYPDWVNTDANQNGTEDLIEAVNGLSAGGATAVYDGTALGIDVINQEPTPKAVIVFTDGQTNSDQYYSINTVIDKAITEGIPLYTIGLGIDPQNLKDMAAATGGQYYYAPTAADMAAIYLDISSNLRSQYRIDYTTHNPVFDGTTRVVTVTCDDGVDTGTGSGIYTVDYKPVIVRDAATIGLSSVSQISGLPLSISGTVIDLDADLPDQALELSLYYRHVGETGYTQIAHLDLEQA